MNKKCGTCVWFNGDCRDSEQFCDEKEEYVFRNNWCPKYREDEYKVKLKEEQKNDNDRRRNG